MNDNERLKRFEDWCEEDLLNQFRIELKDVRKEAQKELLLKLFEKGSYTTQEYIEIINDELNKLNK